MPQPTPALRRQWLVWHFANGANITKTCRHFGISRSTLYRWLARNDPAHPQKPLRARSRRPHHPRKPTWTDEELVTLSQLVALYHPRWGRGRLRSALAAQTGEWRSAATVGRMLRQIVQRCPVCRVGDHRHEKGLHLAAQDLAQRGLPFDLSRSRQRRSAFDPEVAAVIRQAQQFLAEDEDDEEF